MQGFEKAITLFPADIFIALYIKQKKLINININQLINTIN